MTQENEATQIDHEYTDNVVCPHCGHEHCDSWESFTEEQDVVYCEHCKTKFSYEMIVTIEYTTSRDY